MARANTRVGGRIGGRFCLRRVLDSGGTSTVWLAEDERGGGLVALKLLHPKLRRSNVQRGRAQTEAEVLARLNHPNTTALVAADLECEQPYIAMTYASGESLAQRIHNAGANDAMPGAETLLAWFEQICDAVAHAHTLDIIHRDIKPSNIMIGEESLHVLDFGIAKMLDADHHDATTRGRSVGTFLYMSPEQTRGEVVDTRTDVFALGALLYEAATYRHAFGTDRDAPETIAANIATGPRPKVSEVRADLAMLDAVVANALASDRELRTPSVEAFRAALRDALRPAPRLSRFGVWSVVVVGVVILGLSILWSATPTAVESVERPDAARTTPLTTAVEPSASPRPVETPTAAPAEPVDVRHDGGRPAARRKPSAEPSKLSSGEDDLTVLLAEARANPNDSAVLRRLGDAIRVAARSIPDERERGRIERLVDVATMMRRLDGMERAHAALLEARR